MEDVEVNVDGNVEVVIENKEDEELLNNNKDKGNNPSPTIKNPHPNPRDADLKEKYNLKEKPDLNANSNSNYFTLYIYSVLILLIFVIMMFLFFYIHYGRYHIETLVSEKDMIKPLVDDRKYKVIKLTNNLEVLMISDISSSRCSASMSVGVGSFQDDDDISGLAHFTEHMIFLGSKSFPRPGDFEDHLSNYFGLTNAFTEDEKTTFYFEIGCLGFQKSLMMFSRMFAEPLFDINFMSKEINAVNSENDKNLNQDPWREHQLLKHLANPKHPYSRFNTGNNATLTGVDAETLNRRLNSFYSKYYTPNNMKLVVLSNQSLETIQSNVALYFSDIRLDSLQKEQSTKYGEIRTLEKAYTQGELGKIVWFQKLSPTPDLDIVFSFDGVLPYFQTKPVDYISYLLKYSGEGSLIKYLKDKKYANKVEAGIIASYKNFSQFSLSIELTEKGLENAVSVIDAAFNYINLIKLEKTSETIYEEIHNISKTQFKFLEKDDRYGDYLASLAGLMFDYSYNQILYGDYLHAKYDSDLIKKYIDMLIPENVIILVGSNTHPSSTNLLKSLFKNAKNETEPWYKTPFMQAKLSTEMIQILKNQKSSNRNSGNSYEFKLRPKNEFITNENNIVSCLDDDTDDNQTTCNAEMRQAPPVLHLNETNLKVWYRLDRSFLVPRVNIYINIISPLLRANSSTTSDYMSLYIYDNYLKNNIESAFSDLKDTGNEIKLTFDENGYVIKISIFSDLVDKLFTKLLNIIYAPVIDESGFNQLKQMSLDEVKSFKEDQPYKKCRDFFNKIIKYNVTSKMDLAIATSEKLTFVAFSKALPNILNSFSINSLFYGYLKVDQLNSITGNIKVYLEQNRSKNNRIKSSASIPVSTFSLVDYLHEHKTISKPVIFRTKNDLPSEKNHAIQNFFQVGLRDYKTSLVMNIIEMIWGNMFYFYLRTQEQLGYIVQANKEFIDNEMYFVFIVQGNKKSPSEMNLEIDTVIWRLRDKIIALPDAKFKEVLSSIRNELYKKDTNLKERTRRVWVEIFQNSVDFNRKDKLLNEIDNITKSDILEAFDNIFIDMPRKLSIQLYSGDSSKIDTKKEEIYYLNANIKYVVSSDVKILDEMEQMEMSQID